MTMTYDHDRDVDARAQAMASVCDDAGLGFALVDDDPITYRFDLNDHREPRWLTAYDRDPSWAVERDGDQITTTARWTRAEAEAQYNALYGPGGLREQQLAEREYDEDGALVTDGTGGDDR